MAKHRFFCPQLDPGEIVLDPEESRHAAQVLRLPVGAEIDVFDGAGRIATARVTERGRVAVHARVDEVRGMDRPGGPRLTLVTALPRAPRQGFLFEKCTELGVAAVLPARFHRSTVSPRSASLPKWRRTTIEAAKQCGNAYLPVIHEPATFQKSLALCPPPEIRLHGARDGSVAPLADLRAEWLAASSVAIWIGPEGGITDDEVAALERSGSRPISLGRHVLRIETAAIAAAVLLAADR